MDTLEKLYPETPIPLDHKDPYTLLVSVLLSAQCTDARVNTVTPSLFELADNPYDMMKVEVDQIKQIIANDYTTGIWVMAFHLANPKLSLSSPASWSMSMTGRFRPVLKHLKDSLALGIKQHP